VIFDCDGVLVDSERLVQRVEMEQLAELGWPITLAEIYEQHLGRSEADIAANIERHTGSPLPSDFAERRARAIWDAFERELQPVPGINEAIAAVRSAGFSTCVASSGSHDKLRFTLGRTGLYDHFEGRIFSAEAVRHGKPAPDLFLHAAASMQATPTACVVVEDSPAGISAALAGGMGVIGYAGLTPAYLLSKADAVIDDLALLADTIARQYGV
jgi:HAD superfamily hydrolase (TIGR01509 family)